MFCPYCGQSNKGKKITFKSFIVDVFNGFFDFDGKFWSTIIPLLTKPGKVSRDYIDGKRQRFSNPFRFYLTVSILFFLLVGLFKTIQKYENLGKASVNEVINKKEQEKQTKKKKKITPQQIDSIKKEVSNKMDKSFIPIPKKAKQKILDEIEKEVKDTTTLNSINKGLNDNNTLNFSLDAQLDKYIEYVKERPNANIDNALDSLGYEKNFRNRFLFTRAKTVYSLSKSEETREQYFNQLLSYGSIALFILLPIFTLFLKFFYIRRFFTYIEHLIFVFHSQTVFFMLFSIYFILLICGIQPELWLFLSLFALYLFLAMKAFYKQGYIKTFFKFILLNISFGFVALIGVSLLFVLSFILF